MKLWDMCVFTVSFYGDSMEWKLIFPRQIQKPAYSWLAQANNFHSRAISKMIIVNKSKNYFKKAIKDTDCFQLLVEL